MDVPEGLRLPAASLQVAVESVEVARGEPRARNVPEAGTNRVLELRSVVPQRRGRQVEPLALLEEAIEELAEARPDPFRVRRADFSRPNSLSAASAPLALPWKAFDTCLGLPVKGSRPT